MEANLSVFVAKTSNGYIGYVRVLKGRVLQFTEACSTVEQAEREATKMKDVLQEHPNWWD